MSPGGDCADDALQPGEVPESGQLGKAVLLDEVGSWKGQAVVA